VRLLSSFTQEAVWQPQEEVPIQQVGLLPLYPFGAVFGLGNNQVIGSIPQGSPYSLEQLRKLEIGETLFPMGTANLHSYYLSSKLTGRTDSWAVEKAWDLLLKNAAPESIAYSLDPFANIMSRNRVNELSTTNIAGVGPVFHIINPELGLIVNVTLPGHELHPGYVIRRLRLYTDTQRPSMTGLFIESIGQGTGDYRLANDIFEPYIWRRSADQIMNGMN
jgi:hypothetical protein